MNWIQTKAGLQMTQIIIKYLPRITVCLEHLAITLDMMKDDNNNHRRKQIESKGDKHDR